MNIKFKSLIETFNENPEVAEKFMNQKTIDDMYKFCLSISDGYSEEEFEEFIIEMLELADSADKYEYSDQELENAAGGSSYETAKLRAASISLAALMAFSGAGMPYSSISAAKNQFAESVNVTRSSEEKKSKWKKIKDFCSKHKEWIIGGAAAAGVVAGGAVALKLYYNNQNKKVPDNVPKVLVKDNKVTEEPKGHKPSGIPSDTSKTSAGDNKVAEPSKGHKPAGIPSDTSKTSAGGSKSAKPSIKNKSSRVPVLLPKGLVNQPIDRVANELLNRMETDIGKLGKANVKLSKDDDLKFELNRLRIRNNYVSKMIREGKSGHVKEAVKLVHEIESLRNRIQDTARIAGVKLT